MRYLIMLILPLTLIFTIGCEEDEVDKCNDLTTTANDAEQVIVDLMYAYADSLDFIEPCADWIDAYGAALDAGCDDFNQEELDDMVEFCH